MALNDEVTFQTNELSRFYSKKDLTVTSISDDPMIFEALPFIIYRVSANFGAKTENS